VATTQPTMLKISYPHLPGFTLFAFQLQEDLKHCFHHAIQMEAGEGTQFTLQMDDTIIFHTTATTIADIDREKIYDAVCALCEPTGPLPPLRENSEIVEKEWLDCLCSGE